MAVPQHFLHLFGIKVLAKVRSHCDLCAVGEIVVGIHQPPSLILDAARLYFVMSALEGCVPDTDTEECRKFAKGNKVRNYRMLRHYNR